MRAARAGVEVPLSATRVTFPSHSDGNVTRMVCYPRRINRPIAPISSST
jgi:hypothetical protein